MNNDRLKFRVWDKNNKRYIYFDFFSHIQSRTTEIGKVLDISYSSCGDNLIDATYHLRQTDKVEQCTGLRDINCNLIYAGDRGILTVFGGIGPNGGYVDSDKQVNVRVEWVDECAGFYFVDDNGIYYDMTNSTESFEIVGNIHEQKD